MELPLPRRNQTGAKSAWYRLRCFSRPCGLPQVADLLGSPAGGLEEMVLVALVVPRGQ